MKPYEQDAKEILEKVAIEQQQQRKIKRTVFAFAAVFVVLLGATLLVRQVKNRPVFAPNSGSTENTTRNATAGAPASEMQNEPSDPSVLNPGVLPPGESSGESQPNSGVVLPFGTTNEYGAHDAPTAFAPPNEGNAGTEVGTTQGLTHSNDGATSGGAQDDLPVTMERVQTELGVARREETLDEATADRYIAENKEQILYSLSMSGVPTDGDVTISEHGYTHLNLSGGGTWKELATDFRDYLIYNGDRLVAILTLWIMDGEVHASPAFGAPWFDDYNAFLQSHKGEALAFVYLGMTEAVVTPQGEVCNPMGLDLSARFPDSDKGNYYDYLAYPENTYVVP